MSGAGSSVVAESPEVSKSPEPWGVEAGVGAGVGLGARTTGDGDATARGTAVGVGDADRRGETVTETSETAGVTERLAMPADLAAGSPRSRDARRGGITHAAVSAGPNPGRL
ncbi:MAG: hypothetical protein ACXWZW_12535 [Solirubrobacterales bacterium]